MNSFIAQIMRYNSDVVIIDTGDSYLGSCEFFGGKYLTYKEDKPITMNPFRISREEMNLEKFDFLSMLILLIYKESGDAVNKGEEELISRALSEYYYRYFDWKENWHEEKSIKELEQHIKQLGYELYENVDDGVEMKRLHSSDVLEYYTILNLNDECNLEDIKTSYREKAKKYHPDVEGGDAEMFKLLGNAYNGLINVHKTRDESRDDYRGHLVQMIEEIDNALRVESLSFNTFYEFSTAYIPMLQKGKNIQEHDVLMLKHEHLEFAIMKKIGYNYDEAHDLTNTKYNYSLAEMYWREKNVDA